MIHQSRQQLIQLFSRTNHSNTTKSFNHKHSCRLQNQHDKRGTCAVCSDNAGISLIRRSLIADMFCPSRAVQHKQMSTCGCDEEHSDVRSRTDRLLSLLSLNFLWNTPCGDLYCTISMRSAYTTPSRSTTHSPASMLCSQVAILVCAPRERKKCALAITLKDTTKASNIFQMRPLELITYVQTKSR